MLISMTAAGFALQLAGLPTPGPPSVAPAAPPPPSIAPPPPIAAPVGVAVPSVSGQRAAAAGAALARAGLKWRQQGEPSETAPAGRVIETSPAAGELVDKGSTVVLIVAAPIRIPVPDTVGRTAAEASAELRRAGLRSRQREEANARVASGRVIGSRPAAGQTVDKGATVTLLVARPPAPVYRPPPVRTPPSYPSSAAATAAPWTRQPSAPAYGAAARPPTPSPPPPPQAPAPTQAPLSGDALIQHLYDNAHASY
jgi:serine/threonine-protein kinase